MVAPITERFLLLNTQRAAKLLGYAPKTLCNWRSKGIGPPCIKSSYTVRYDYGELLSWKDRTFKPRAKGGK